MDDFTDDAFVNRDEPIPVVQLDAHDDASDSAEPSYGERKRDRFWQHGKNIKDNLSKAHEKADGYSMQDRLLDKYTSSLSPLADHN